MLTSLLGRLYSDYVRPDRFTDYLDLLRQARAASYRMVTVGEYRDLRLGAGLPEDGRVLILRHDIDTCPEVCAAFALAEAAVGARASYYFRLGTADVSVMQALAAAGHEVGYHYEELATVAKERGVNHPDRLPEILEEARERFAANLATLRARTGLPLRGAASHGDFANRALGVGNTRVLEDRALRECTGIVLEAYDPEVEEGLALRVMDDSHPRDWVPSDPAAGIRQGLGPIRLLTHPRQWGRKPLANGREDAARYAEGLLFKAGLPRRQGPAPA